MPATISGYQEFLNEKLTTIWILWSIFATDTMKKALLVFCFLLAAFRLIAGEDMKMFSLYPVPLKTSKLSVKRNTQHAENSKIAKVELRSLIGKKLQSHDFDKNTEEVIFEDMETYPNGIYVVIALDAYGKIIETAKFIINR